MKSLVIFLNVKWIWACQNPLIWANLALSILTAVLIYYAGSVDIWLRSWSLALQLLGAIVVWRDLIGAASDFGSAEIIRRNWIWLKAGVGIPTIVTVSADLTINSSVSGAFAQARVAFDPNAPLEQRVAGLESYVAILSESIAQATAHLHTTKSELYGEIRQTRTDLERSLAATNAQLKNAVVGNYPKLLFGGFWVGVGTILSTYAPDITTALSGKWSFCPLPLDNVDYLRVEHLAQLLSSG